MIDADFDFWIKNNLNVLFVGKHGVGKTARVLEAFKRHNLKWVYFSASTLDPWVDFIGVPKEYTDPKSGKTYLELVRPKCFAEDEVEAIFLDEGNRAPKKVRNAIMELIQFKSINGKKFNNLRFVWTAINPEEAEEGEEEYDVETLDPAQKDRFQIQVEIPYKPDRSYFIRTHGEEGEYAVDWWDECSQQVKNAVSPRRLDYAVSIHKLGGNLRHVLPSCANVSKFVQELAKGSYRKKIEEMKEVKDPELLRKFINTPNNFSNCIGQIVKKDELLAVFLPYISDERVAELMSKDDRLLKYIDNNLDKHTSIVEMGASNLPHFVKRTKKYINISRYLGEKKAKIKAKQFKDLSFKKAFVLPKRERSMRQIASNFNGANDIGSFCLYGRFNQFMNQGTAYREIVFNSINTLSKQGVEKFTETQLIICINLLCEVIRRSNTLNSYSGNFKNLNQLFGALICCYVPKVGSVEKALKQINQSDKISRFIERNKELFN